MSDLWKAIIQRGVETFSKLRQEGRSAAGLRRRAGRYERYSISARSQKRKDRLNKKAKQLLAQADRMDSQ